MAPRGSSEDPKVTALRESRCLNPHPEQVTDPVPPGNSIAVLTCPFACEASAVMAG